MTKHGRPIKDPNGVWPTVSKEKKPPKYKWWKDASACGANVEQEWEGGLVTRGGVVLSDPNGIWDKVRKK